MHTTLAMDEVNNNAMGVLARIAKQVCLDNFKIKFYYMMHDVSFWQCVGRVSVGLHA